MEEEEFIERLSEESADARGLASVHSFSGRDVAAIHALVHHNTRKRFDSADYFQVREEASRRAEEQRIVISDDEFMINEAKIVDRQLHHQHSHEHLLSSPEGGAQPNFLPRIREESEPVRIAQQPNDASSQSPKPSTKQTRNDADFSGTTSEDGDNSDPEGSQRVSDEDDLDDEEDDDMRNPADAEDPFARYERAMSRHNLYARHAVQEQRRLQRFDSADYWTEQEMLHQNAAGVVSAPSLSSSPAASESASRIHMSEHDVAMQLLTNTRRARLQRFDSADYFQEKAEKEQQGLKDDDDDDVEYNIVSPSGQPLIREDAAGSPAMFFGSPDTRVHQFLAHRAIADKGRPRARSSGKRLGSTPPMPSTMRTYLGGSSGR